MNCLLNLIFVTVVLLLSVSVNQCFADGESRFGTIVEDFYEVMHQVSIQIAGADKIGEGHICGGALIANDTVLTAAHCVMGPSGSVRKPDELIIIAGSLYLTGLALPSTHASSITKSIKVHENYNSATFENDIAIIKLETGIYKFNSIYGVNLRTVPLQFGGTCQVTGWGHLSYLATTNTIYNDLRTEDILLYTSDLCNSVETPKTPGMLCVSSLACTSDSGGPVICDNILTGIVSFGKGCNLGDFPAVYTDVEYHKQWITANANHGNNLKINFLVLTVFCIFSIFYFK